MSEITITRARVYRDMARAYQVIVDGENRAEVRNGKTTTLEVAPGDHVVQLNIDWCSSPPLTVTAGDAPVRLSCRPSSSWNAFAAFFSPKAYIRLEQAG